MKTVIIESPGKIKKIKSYLGSDYDVITSFGHCVDLPAKGLSVNIKKDFEPTFAVNEDKLEVIVAIIKSCKKSKAVYLMMDPDREGAGIARNIYEQIKNLGVPVYRAISNEISQSKIKEAIANAAEVEGEQAIYDAYVCRRILDRIAGYKTSFLTQQATGGRSAGRVQSAMLRIITEREKEILHFIPEEYWVLTAHLHSSKKEPYTAILDEKVRVPNEKTATEIYEKVIKGTPTVTSVDSQEVSVNPYAPFTTSTMIQSFSTSFGWTANKTMKTAQGLYETGHITYMRTDSPMMAKEAVTAVRDLIDHEHGSDYLHPTVRFYSAKKGAQEGHECCRPTDVSILHVPGSTDTVKMYEMIWRRAIASQMTAGKDRRLKVTTKIGGYSFISRGNVRLFDGFRKCWIYSKQQDVLLPPLEKGEKCTLAQLDTEQKWTMPPSRYSDASLQKKCDASQITRPATFASFLTTLEDRGYIKREKKSFHATDLGIRVVDFLVAADMCFVDMDFTAEMETWLDEVATGHKDKLVVLKDFWEKLKGNIENGKKVKGELEKTDFPCPDCKGTLRHKHSRFGSFFSCENYKKDGTGCKYTAKVGEGGKPVDKVQKIKEYASFMCEHCGGKMVKRKSTFGEFFGCDSYPTCKGIADLTGKFQPLKKEGKKSASWNKKKKTPKTAKKTKKKSNKS